ncbi:uncharacterized protein [Amphiura filiformis]|uniref:uncharacterized protein n=1 Tax=Amphiura filiformis TaxID=82378 RepID=UPI003B21357B
MSSTGRPSYDYIVVGAGTAGCIVATRLTEDARINVLLLEAGSSDVNDIRVRSPSYLISAFESEIDWNYKTVPQKYALKGYKDNICVWPRGKVLGGSSSINGMCWVRGHYADYDSWAKQGCTGWGWKDVEKYFQKSENFMTEKPTQASRRCAIDITTHPFHRTEVAQSFVKAGVKLGYAEVDINSGQNIGFGPFPATIDFNGERSSTATGYLHTVIGRDNLKVLTKAQVRKVTFEGNVATGVVVQQGGGQTFYSASKEIILCGGAINSPQLLMLSGVGPKEHLADMGIQCIVDLPVGKNLQDHLQIPLRADVKPGSDVYTGEKRKTKTNASEVTAFVRSKLERTNEWPDCQLMISPMFYRFGLLAHKLQPVKDSRYFPQMGLDRAIGDAARREGFTFRIILLHPKSTGEIRLKDADPLSHPIIDPRYLEDIRDVDVMVEQTKCKYKNEAHNFGLQYYGIFLTNLIIFCYREKPVHASSRCAIDITTHPFHRTEVAGAFVKAGVKLGHTKVDINSGQNIGFGPFPAAIDFNGERSSSSTGYLHTVIGRANLKVLTKAHVTKITFEGNIATGVVVQQDDGQKVYTASKEVILCGGAINTPQLLMLSGVGPKEHLADMGIQCIADLPVGKNLQDHLQLHLRADVKPGSDVYTAEKRITKTNTSEVTAFIRSPLERTHEWPDYQLMMKPMFYQFGLLVPKLFPVTDSRFFPQVGYDRALGDVTRREGFTFQVISLHPRSTGEIRLKDADPLSHPIIDPRYLEDKRDVDVMVEGIRLSRKIAETEAMRPFEMRFVNLNMHGNVHDEWSDENLADFVRHFAWTIYHPIGTCKMGSSKDRTAVVDPELRVRGLGKLRVVDASIMPHLTSGNTVAPVGMIAEKSADMIKRDLYANSSKL